jgi:hypothetical protein
VYRIGRILRVSAGLNQTNLKHRVTHEQIMHPSRAWPRLRKSRSSHVNIRGTTAKVDEAQLLDGVEVAGAPRTMAFLASGAQVLA